eukprot:TRINITY_DN10220_c0_g1_i1.p1 TRINITY_DN10220_c0_g1~~TRINITY_DN10220_c0_g1_i1.p1  ORF type:complete len:436 (+),score=46.21 TRINITY_DN10220_c0_g1_i1:149-1456(+)
MKHDKREHKNLNLNFYLKSRRLFIMFVSFNFLLYGRVFLNQSQGITISKQERNSPISEPCYNASTSNDVEAFYACVINKLRLRQHFPNERGFWHLNGLIRNAMLEQEVTNNASINTIPNQKFLDVGKWDPGHGLNNIRTMYVLALVWSKFLNRTLVLPDLIPKGPVKFNPSPERIPITDLFDIEEMNRIGNPDYRIVTKSQLPPYLAEMEFPPFGLEGISGNRFRSANFRWYENDVIRLLNHYEGIYVTAPYYFCDGRSPLFNDERRKANNLIKFSKSIESDVNKILDNIRLKSENKKLVALHPRTAAIYGGRDSANWNSLDSGLNKRYPPNEHVIYLSSEYSAHIATFLKNYSVFDKEAILGKQVQDKDSIQFKFSAIDFEVCRRSQIFLGESLGSSFDAMIAHLRGNQTSKSWISWSEICGVSPRIIECFFVC